MIPGIASIGGTELLIPLVMAFLFLGVKRFPEIGRPFGIGVKELRKEVAHTIGSDDRGASEQRPHNKVDKTSEDGNDTPSAAGKRMRSATAGGGKSV